MLFRSITDAMKTFIDTAIDGILNAFGGTEGGGDGGEIIHEETEAIAAVVKTVKNCFTLGA